MVSYTCRREIPADTQGTAQILEVHSYEVHGYEHFGVHRLPDGRIRHERIRRRVRRKRRFWSFGGVII